MSLQELEDGINGKVRRCDTPGCGREVVSPFSSCSACDVAAGKARLRRYQRRKQDAAFLAKVVAVPLLILGASWLLVRGCIVVWGML